MEPDELHPDPHVTVDTKDLKRRFDQLSVLRKPVEGVWDQIERYFMPLGSGTHPYTQLTEGSVEWKRTDVWDSTAIDAAQKLAAMIHGNVTSSAIRWFKLAWRSRKLGSDVEAAKWLDDLADAVFQTLQDSDFQPEIASADQDLVGYGNAVLIEEAASETTWKGVDFSAVPIREAFFEADSRGGVERFYRLLSWSAVQIFDRFGDRTPPKIREQALTGRNLEQLFQVVFAVWERPREAARLEAIAERNRERRRARASAVGGKPGARQAPVEPDEPTYPLAPHLRPYGCVYFLAETGEGLSDEGGYYEMPVVWGRWQKTSGSIWGHGPCGTLLPTVQGLNAWLETELSAAAKVVDPAWATTERGVMSDLDLEPGGITVVRSKDDIWVLESGARFDSSARTISDHRAMVQRGLHNDELTLKDSPAMTAAEVNARYELMNKVLGSTLARIETDILSPIVKITIGHLLRAGQLQPMPASVAGELADGGAQFNIEYQGPLARSQRTDEVAAIERVLAFAAAQLKMGVPLDIVQAVVDLPAAIRQVAKLLGTPAGILKPTSELEKALATQDAAAQQQRKQSEAAASKAQSDAMMSHAQARAAIMSAPPSAVGGLPPGPVPAQPAPVVSPSFGPTAPFTTPPPGM